jgi:hypothetical protein
LSHPAFWHASCIHIPHQSLRQIFRRIGKFATTAKKAARSKSRGREEQSLHIAQAGAQEVSIPKQTSANPLSPSQNPQKSAAGF